MIGMSLRRRSPFAPYDPNDPDQAEADQNMYGPNLGPSGGPPPQPPSSPPSMFTPAPMGAMPNFSQHTRDVTQSAPIDMNAAPKIPEARSMYAPAEDTQRQTDEPTGISGLKPPRVYNANDPEVKANMGPVDRLDGARRFRVAEQMSAMEERRYERELAASTISEGHRLQAQSARNIGTAAPAESQLIATIRDPDADPALKAWAQQELDKARRFSGPQEKAAHYTRSVEVVGGKPTVVWVNDNDPTDRHLGGPAAPHEFAPERTQIVFTPTGQPLATKGGTISSPTWSGPPLPEQAGPTQPGVAPPATAPSAGSIPPGPYTKGGGQVGASPQDYQEAARSLANYDLTALKNLSSWRGDQRLKLFAMARQINPTFNSAEIDRRIKAMDDVTNGKTGTNIQSLGTFLEHAGELSDVIRGISQTDSPALNRPINWFRANVSGSPDYQRLLTAIEPVGKEFEAFLLNNRALYEEDRKDITKLLSGNMNLGQIQATLNQMGRTVNARYNEMNGRFKRTMGGKTNLHDAFPEMFSPEAEQAAQKIGIRLAGQPGGPAGGPSGAPSQKFSHVSESGKYGWDGTKWQPIQ